MSRNTLRLDNLPAPLSSFIGREPEIAQVKQLLESHRLVTLTGPGGSGKTRLALQVANELRGDYKDGIWLAELASLSDGALVTQTVASQLNVREQAGQPLMDTLADYLFPRQALLVIDNCEHLIQACAQLVQTILERCPNLRILATSREMLGVTGESTWIIPPLTLPEEQPWKSPASAQNALNVYGRSEAVQLFVNRATSIMQDFTLNTENGAWVSEICRRLDGMPLAIELAASRVRALSVQQIAEKLDDRFHLLIGGNRTAEPRQQTLSATLDWSYALLSEMERKVLQRLSVFAGGSTLEAAEMVCADEGLKSEEVLDVLSHLVEKSLVVVDRPEGGETRYRMLETVRQYSQVKLEETGEVEALRNRHLDFFLKFAQTAEKKLHGPEEFAWLDRLDMEQDNFRAALDWSLDEGSMEKGSQVVAALLWFWQIRGHIHEGRDRAEKLLTQTDPTSKTLLRANGLLVAGILTTGWYVEDINTSLQYLEELVVIARELGESGERLLAPGLVYLSADTFVENRDLAETMMQEGLAIATSLGDQWLAALALRLKAGQLRGRSRHSVARHVSEESLRLCQSIGDKRGAAESLLLIGQTFSNEHDYVSARQKLEQSLLSFQEVRDQPNIALALNLLGENERADNQYDKAKRYYLESLKMNRELGRKASVSATLGNLGFVALHDSELGAARSLITESFALIVKTTFIKPLIASNLFALAALITVEKNAPRAIPLLAFFQTVVESASIRTLTSADEAEYERYLVLARKQLDEATFNALWEQGKVMTQEQALVEAEKILTSEPLVEVLPKEQLNGLTGREREVAVLIAQGKSNREIANAMTVGIKTVETYVTRILNKLGFDSRVQIAIWSIEKGLYKKETE